MKLDLDVFDALCTTKTFKINGIDADTDDFGENNDHDEANAEAYCCGNMHFDPKLPTEEVLNKYKITVGEYGTICNELESKLSFGNCGWCS